MFYFVLTYTFKDTLIASINYVCMYLHCLVTKMNPRPSLVPEADTSDAQNNQLLQQKQPPKPANNTQKTEPGKPPSRAGACRVCLKSFKPDDFSKTCYECQQRVCEDCASYSKLDDHEDAVSRMKTNCTHFLSITFFLDKNMLEYII